MINATWKKVYAQNIGRRQRIIENSAHDDPRIDMHDQELNRVQGGGLVPGSIVLLGGEPGIGKSTLSLQTMLQLTDKKVLYVSGEESAHQLKMRAERLLKVQPNSQPSTVSAKLDNFLLLCENSLEAIFDHIKEVQPELVVKNHRDRFSSTRPAIIRVKLSSTRLDKKINLLKKYFNSIKKSVFLIKNATFAYELASKCY